MQWQSKQFVLSLVNNTFFLNICKSIIGFVATCKVYRRVLRKYLFGKVFTQNSFGRKVIKFFKKIGSVMGITCDKITTIAFIQFYRFINLKKLPSSICSKISPGWHSRIVQISSNVLNLIAFAFPLFKILILDIVIPAFSLSCVKLIFLFASITSKFTTIGILNG